MSETPPDLQPAPAPPQKSQGRLTTGPVRGHLVSLSVPMIWGLFAVIFINVVDTYFVARLGTRELAAISFTFPIIMILGTLSIGLGIGATSVISRGIGQGDRERVRRLSTDALLLGMVIVGVVVAAGLATITPLFTALGAGPDIMPLIHDYMSIWYFGSFFLVVPMIGNSIIRATGDAKFPSYIMIAAAVLNGILDPLFIFGYLGFPRLEIEGAAVATVISRAVTFVVTLLVLHYRERLLVWVMPPLQVLIASWKALLHVGLPAALTQMINPIGQAVVTAIVARYGVEAVAGYGVATRIEALSVIPLMALSAGLSPFVGQNGGASLFDRVIESLRLAGLFAIAWSVLIAVILAVAGPYVVALFDDHAVVRETASLYLWIVPASFAGYGLMLVAIAGFNSLGRPGPATALAAIRMFGVLVPLAALAAMALPILWVFAAAALANVVAGGLSWWWSGRYCGMRKRAAAREAALA